MNGATEYPKGAMQTMDEALETVGTVIYNVLAMGGPTGNHYMAIILTGNVTYPLSDSNSILVTPQPDAAFFDHRHPDWGWQKPDQPSCSSFGDRNIPLNGYNNHFLFKTLEDAEAYIAWANENLPDQLHEDWFDYPDYDD